MTSQPSPCDANTTPFALSLLTSTRNNASKKLIADHEGRPHSDPAHTLGITGGTIQHVALAGLAGLRDLLGKVTTAQALVHGVHKGSAPGELCELLTLDKLARLAKQGKTRQPTQIARSLEYIAYPQGPRLIMLDIDPAPDVSTPESPEALMAQLAAIWPAFTDAGWLATVSTRSAIKAKSSGEWLAPPTGRHIYVLATGDVARWRDVARVRLWLAGAGYCVLASPHAHTGVPAVLERCVIDLSVFSPERLDFVAGAIIAKNAPFYQDRPTPELHPGVVLDLDSLPDVTDDERQQYHRLVQAARARVQPEREAKVRAHIQHASPALDAETIAHEMTARLQRTDQGMLTPDHPLMFDHRRTVVLAGAAAAALDGKRLADPFEPDYRDGADAIFHWHGGNWVINSFAHGLLKTYRLASADREAPGPAEDEPPPWTGEVETGGAAWPSELQRKKNGDLEPILSNVLLILRNHDAWQGVMGYNSFTERAVVRTRPPYTPETATPWMPRQVRDLDDSLTNDWLQRTYGLLASTGLVAEGIQVLAHAAPFNPLQDYLLTLVWDKIPRLDTWLETYACTTPPPTPPTPPTPPPDILALETLTQHLTYRRSVGAKTLIAAVARGLAPGCQVDTMTIFEGNQGTRKSSVWRALAGGEDWFFDGLRDLSSKDADEALIGKWIVEFPELSIFSRTEVEAVKQFISKRNNEFRLPYARRSSLHHRSNVFVGSTNNYHWAKDATGNRRFWPIKVYGDMDLDGIIRDRDQLWAEAVVRYQAGEDWYLSKELEAIAQQEQAERLEADDWEERMLTWLHEPVNKRFDVGGRQFVTTLVLLTDALQIEKATDHTQVATKRLGGLLRRNGWTPDRVRETAGGQRIRAWIAPLDAGTGGTGGTADLSQYNSRKNNIRDAGTGGTGSPFNIRVSETTCHCGTCDTCAARDVYAYAYISNKGKSPVPPVPAVRTTGATQATTPKSAGTGPSAPATHDQAQPSPRPGRDAGCPACGADHSLDGFNGQRICLQCPHTWQEV